MAAHAYARRPLPQVHRHPAAPSAHKLLNLCLCTPPPTPPPRPFLPSSSPQSSTALSNPLSTTLTHVRRRRLLRRCARRALPGPFQRVAVWAQRRGPHACRAAHRECYGRRRGGGDGGGSGCAHVKSPAAQLGQPDGAEWEDAEDLTVEKKGCETKGPRGR